MSIHPSYWGKEVWHTMYAIAFGYPEEGVTPEVKAQAIAFYRSLGLLLPCDTCRKNYSTLLEKYPVEDAVDGRAALTLWVHKIHVETTLEAQQQNSSIKNIDPLHIIKQRFDEARGKENKERNKEQVVRHIVSYPIQNIIIKKDIGGDQPVRQILRAPTVRGRGCNCGK
jgi:hypothetical protein